jgi:hypothetical protein
VNKKMVVVKYGEYKENKMKNFEYIDEPEEPSIDFPFNVPDKFLDGEDEEDDLTVVRRILKFIGIAA